MSPWQALLHGLGDLLAFFYEHVFENYGVAIILLTVLVRVAMLPLTIKQLRSMQASQKLAPELNKLREKYKGKENRMKLHEETMKLYKEHNASPAGGCLPTILQLPVFFALYQVLSRCAATFRLKSGACSPGSAGTLYLAAGSELYKDLARGNAAGFLGMNLTNTPKEAFEFGVVAFIPYALLLLFMAFTSWLQQKQVAAMQVKTGNPTQDQMAQQMQLMGKIFPVMFLFFSYTLPTGVTLYWVATNVWTIGQQYFLLHRKAERTPTQQGSPPPSLLSRLMGGGTTRNGSDAEAPSTNGKQSNGSAKGTAKQPSETTRASSPGKPKGSGAKKKKRRKR